MIIAIVTFEIDKELNDTVLKEKFLETSPIYKDTPGLIRKNYICDTSTVYWLTQDFNEQARKLYDNIGTFTSFIKYNRN